MDSVLLVSDGALWFNRTDLVFVGGACVVVTELEGFEAWYVLFKSLYLLASVKETGIHIQSFTALKGGLAIAYTYHLVSYTLISSLQLPTLTWLGSHQAPSVYSWPTKYCAIF